MKERPIIFSGPMVQAIRAGRKTQTRRIVRVLRHGRFPSEEQESLEIQGMECIETNEPGYFVATGGRTAYAAGQRLWVRETFYIDLMPWDVEKLPQHRPDGLDERDMYYRADGECCQQIPECSCGEIGKPRWRPSIFMPRWASRLTLEVTGIRVERLQEISDDDAIAEGVDAVSLADMPRQATWSHRQDFAQIWDRINAKRGPWESNPWVWVVEFRKLCTGHSGENHD